MTTFSKFRQNKYYTWLIDPAQIILTKQGHKKMATDPRSFQDEEGEWHIYPIAINKIQVVIVCPYCQHVHFHGKGDGYRRPHCALVKDGWKDYYLVSTRSPLL